MWYNINWHYKIKYHCEEISRKLFKVILIRIVYPDKNKIINFYGRILNVFSKAIIFEEGQIRKILLHRTEILSQTDWRKYFYSQYTWSSENTSTLCIIFGALEYIPRWHYFSLASRWICISGSRFDSLPRRSKNASTPMEIFKPREFFTFSPTLRDVPDLSNRGHCQPVLIYIILSSKCWCAKYMKSLC